MRKFFFMLLLVLVVFTSGCVEKPANGIETEEKLVEEPANKEIPIEEPQTKANATPEERKETTPSTPELLSWQKEEGIRISDAVSSSTIFLNNQYWMYYTGDGIALATSADGLSFIKWETVIKNGPIGSEQEIVTNPAVFELPDGRYRMIYEGSKWVEYETGKRYQTDRKLYSAVSSDGREWTKETGARFWDSGDGKPGEIFTSVPDVIRLPDGRLRMYYTRGATSATALSNDEGLTWTKETNLELRKISIDPDIVLLDNGTYKLFFTTFEDEFGVGEQWVAGASSVDGINFVLDEGKLIGPSAASGMNTDPDVITVGNGYRMYYGEFIETKKGEFKSNILSAFSAV